MQHLRGRLGSAALGMVSLISVLLQVFRLLSSQLHVLHELCEVLQGGVVRVGVGEGRIVSVNVERHWQQLRHDAVVGDEGSQAGVNLQETLEYLTLYFWAVFLAYFYLISLVQYVDDIVSYSSMVESIWHAH